ncbi:MAG: amidohydrolase family protein [Nitrososphaerota archaeon]
MPTLLTTPPVTKIYFGTYNYSEAVIKSFPSATPLCKTEIIERTPQAMLQPIVDSHIHKPRKAGLVATYSTWAKRFANRYGLESMEEAFRLQMMGAPRIQSILTYLADVYGLEPEIAAVDAKIWDVMTGGFERYVEAVMDREGIVHAIMDLSIEVAEPEQVSQALDGLAPGRFSWTFNIVDMLHPQWAVSRSVKDVGELLGAISNQLHHLKKMGCRGLKNSMAYYRGLGISMVDEERADSAYKWLAKNKTEEYVESFPRPIPRYPIRDSHPHHLAYQDFVLRHIYIEAGKTGLPILIHVASALHPALTPINNDPRGLYSVLEDGEIMRAGTRFLILHGGYPLHREVATILSQHPNAYADTSFFSQYPAILEEMLTTFLQLAPHNKIMHGSDSNFFAEIMAYAANNMRRCLGRVLSRFESDWGWSSKHCRVVAESVLSKNAVNFFGL